MVLLLRPHTNPDRFTIMSGQEAVGTIIRIVTEPDEGAWAWLIVGWIDKPPPDLGSAGGVAATRDGALEAFADRWRAWLAWARLQEVEAPPCLRRAPAA
jgi:hypothetical protein